MKNILLGAATVVAFVASAAVFADHGANVTVREVSVGYSDVEANSAPGAARLYARLKSAARAACGTDPGRALDAQIDFQRCRADALSAAVNDVHSRALTALHRSRLSPLELARLDGMASAR